VRDRLVLLGFGALEPLGYRRLTAVWRVRGLVRHWLGRTDWGAMERERFGMHDRPRAGMMDR
jgi:hypothetical protein